MSVHRGTSNTNVRSGAPARRRSKVRMMQRYAADVDLVTREELDELWVAMVDDDDPAWWQAISAGAPDVLWVDTYGVPDGWVAVRRGLGRQAARCYRCGLLLVFETAERDRIRSGAEGGTYVDANIRPCCSPCNIVTGREIQTKLAAAKKARKAAAAAYRARRKALVSAACETVHA